ncbi:MAG TPA: hypothetical protein ACFYEC_03460, partial [Candidatus Brocadiaceae bacterium]
TVNSKLLAISHRITLVTFLCLRSIQNIDVQVFLTNINLDEEILKGIISRYFIQTDGKLILERGWRGSN